jgi:hypothetical protein
MIGIRGARRSAVAAERRVRLTTGIRASRGRVGYIGSQVALTILHNNDPLPGGWNAHWDTGALIVLADNVTIDHYEIHGAVIFTGNNPTMTNCKVFSNPGDFFGVTVSGTGHGVLTITDTTVIGDPSSGTPQVNGISSDSGLVARRCDVSQSGDGIHMTSQPNATDAIISQCYIHNLAFIDENQHLDGIQIFNNPSSTGFFTVEHNYIERSLSTIGTPMNSAMTCGTPTDDLATPLATAIINNNYFDSGLYHLRVNSRLHNITVSNNTSGPLYPSEFGIWDMEVPVATWSNNKNADGTTPANPAPLVAPTIRETLVTTGGVTTTQTLNTTAGTTTAGDTLVVIYGTDGNSVSANPTSSAGTLSQVGVDIKDGNGNGIFRVFSAPITTSGSKSITIPAASGFDIYGVAMVFYGSIEIEGYTRSFYASSNTTFLSPTTILTGGKDMLFAVIAHLQNASISLSGSGLTQQANLRASSFSAMAVGTVALAASGTTSVYTFTTSGLAKPGIAMFGVQRLRL